MHSRSDLLKVLKAAICLAVLFIAALPADAWATHFRYGHLTWRAQPDVAPGAVDLTLTLAVRRCGYRGTGADGCAVTGDVITETIGGTTINFGDGSFAPTAGSIQMRVTAYDIASDWIIAVALDPATGSAPIRHIYSAANNSGQPWVASISTCCRLLNVQNAPNGSYRVETLIDLSQALASPLSNLPPIVACEQGTTCVFGVPASTSGVATVNWRLALPQEDGGIAHPAGLSVNSTTGIVTWSTVAVQTGTLWTTQIVVESKDRSTGNVLSRSAVDFLIVVLASGNPPVIVPPPNSAPICNTSVPAIVDQVVSFDIAASDSNSSDSVTLNTAGLPSGASMTPPLPLTGNPVTSTFSWTPTTSDVGTTIITFIATDQLGLQALCPVTIEVVETPVGIIIGGGRVGSLAPGVTGLRPDLRLRRNGVLLTYSTTTDFNVLLPHAQIQRSATADQGVFDLTIQNNWQAWYYVTTLPVGLVSQSAPSAFILPPGEPRSFRVTFRRGDRLTLFASAGFNIPPVDRQDRLLLGMFAFDFLWRLVQGSRLPYSVVSSLESALSISSSELSPFLGLGVHIGTGNVFAIPDDVRRILQDKEFVKTLVKLGYSESQLERAAELSNLASFATRVYFVTELMLNELIAATTRPYGDLIYEAE